MYFKWAKMLLLKYFDVLVCFACSEHQRTIYGNSFCGLQGHDLQGVIPEQRSRTSYYTCVFTQ